MTSILPSEGAPRRAGRILCSLLALSAALAPARAQDNQCDPGEAPDIVVGDIHEVEKFGVVGGIHAFTIGTFSCNVGDCEARWEFFSNQHPVIGQNMFRLENDRFEQIGQAWVKHGFNALSLELCSTGCIPTFGTSLGVNCADPYSSQTNGEQTNLGPKFEVDAWTGFHPHPVTDMDRTGDAIYKRLQVRTSDIDPLLHPAALWFVEGQYVAEDDAAAGNHYNNASYRQVLVTGAAGNFDLQLAGTTQREKPAILAWSDNDPGVTVTIVDVPGEGRFYVAAKAIDRGGGVWSYEYAVQNLNSHRSARGFHVPIPFQAAPASLGFHDVDYHSGEPFFGDDWTPQVTDTEVSWTTATFAQNPDANALRWGTLYNFRFEIAAPPETGAITLDLFRPGTPDAVTAVTVVPRLCDSDGVCEAGESCENCVSDCPDTGPDGDGDAVAGCVDCDDTDGSIWAPPGEVRNLRIDAAETLHWDPPLEPGADTVEYETLRSSDPADFTTGVTCLSALDPTSTSVDDPDRPAAGALFSYLVRATNRCPLGEGPLGNASDGTPRAGASCP